MNEHPPTRPEIPPETRRAIILWILQAALGLVGYGAILFLTAGSLGWVWGWALLAVLAAFIPSLALAALYTLRTYLEDRTLIDDLPGYEEYIRRTPYRLVPGVW
jgi:hypothetical protein